MTENVATRQSESTKQPLYKSLWAQVLVAIVLAVVVGFVRPNIGVALKPLGDAFIKLISMIITLVIFCTVVSGIAGMKNLKKVGRVGGKALLYFEVISTLALLIGLLVGNTVHPGAGLNINAASLDAKSVSTYANQSSYQTTSDFLLHIIPTTVVDAFAKGDILEVLFVAILFGLALSIGGPRCQPVTQFIQAMTATVFSVVNIVMRFAPIGAFGAMAFTIGRYGISSLGPLAKLILVFYVTAILFILVVLGGVARVCGFRITRFLSYIKEEILLVLATSSSETALPTLMEKLEKLGCSEGLVGLVVPTGYTFNTDGTSLYMTLAALFVAQATNTHLSLRQQLTLFAVAILTSKGASGVQGAAFVALVGTLMVVPSIPVAGMAIILGIDRFLSMFRAVVNMVGNGVATLVVARWERELDAGTLRQNLALPSE
ncbi:MAG: dicarboxylate/amino acid:cation symporter [Acidobacteriaceae bacterium]|jgi:aerobic C4-dicarboxylate transport protein